jgi:hypothetical protein
VTFCSPPAVHVANTASASSDDEYRHVLQEGFMFIKPEVGDAAARRTK